MSLLLPFIESSLKQLFTIRYANISAAALIAYDHLSTLDREVELIWKRRWSTGKVLFLLIRYQALPSLSYQLIGLLSNDPTLDICRGWIPFQAFVSVFTFFLTEMVLLLRVYAMYNQSKIILALITTFFISATTASAVLVGMNVHRTRAAVIPTTSGHICSALSSPKFPYLFLAPIISSESLLFILALVKGFQTFRSRSFRQNSSYPSLRKPSLLHLLVKDSILYFFTIFSSYLALLLIWVFQPAGSQWFLLFSTYSAVFPTIMSERLILHVLESQPRSIFDSTAPSTAPSLTAEIYVEDSELRDAFWDE